MSLPVPVSTLPLTISKSEFKRMFKTTTRSFREKFFTNEVITDVLKLSVDDFNRLRYFDVPTTKRIIEYFHITPEMLN